MIPRARIGIRAAAVAAIAFLGGCGDAIEPITEGLPAELGMSFAIIGEAASVAGVFDKADNLEVTVAMQDREPVTRTFRIASGQSTIEVRMQLTLEQASAVAEVHVELKQGDTPLFAGSESITLEQAQQQQLAVDLSAVAAQLLVPSTFEVEVLGQPVALSGQVGFATGDPIPDAEVVWSSSESDIQVTQDGQLTAMRNGTYSVMASGRGFTETVPVIVDAPPTGVEFVAGHEQTANPGQPVEESPVVLVTHGSFPMPGAEVHFSADMGGTVSHEVVATDDTGHALLPEWRLGPEGENTLTATVVGLPAATLVAEAGDPCQIRTPVEIGEKISGEYDADLDCIKNGFQRDRYVLSLNEHAVVDVTLESAATEARFQAWIGDIEDAETDDMPPSGDAIVASVVAGEGDPARWSFVLPPGDYVIESMARGEGAYTLSTALLDEPEQDCRSNVYGTSAVPGSLAHGTITTEDCGGNTLPHLDRYYMWVPSGHTVSVSLTANFTAEFWHENYGDDEVGLSDRIPAGGSYTFTVTGTNAYHGFVVLGWMTDENLGSYTLSFSAGGSQVSQQSHVEPSRAPPAGPARRQVPATVQPTAPPPGWSGGIHRSPAPPGVM